MSGHVIQVNPERVTPKGRQRPADYLVQFNYPPLLSGQRPTATLVENPSGARVFTDAEASVLDSALDLLRSMGYDPEAVEV